uniref:Uncharacterized protein n=1 Tax=Knipowitschia caucasica TaxID=637954 RepID=A0AAV2K7M5_KNICA
MGISHQVCEKKQTRRAPLQRSRSHAQIVEEDEHLDRRISIRKSLLLAVDGGHQLLERRVKRNYSPSDKSHVCLTVHGHTRPSLKSLIYRPSHTPHPAHKSASTQQMFST